MRMKRPRGVKETPSFRKVQALENDPGTPGPHNEDLARSQQASVFPAASPRSTKKLITYRKQLFGSPTDMVETRNMAASDKGSTASLQEARSDDDLSQPGPGPSQLPSHEVAVNLDNPLPNIVNLARSPARRHPAAPEIEDVLTQQTQVLAGIMRRLDDVQARPPAVAAGNAMDQPEDPNYQWNALRVATTTNFPVPSTGAVQRMASSLLSKLSSLQGRDNHDARFVLQMTSLWPDMDEDDRRFVFQRLNL